MRGHVCTDVILEDYCDSPKAKQHSLFGKIKHTLQIILYFDEVELCNPLGAFRKKHKLGKLHNDIILMISISVCT